MEQIKITATVAAWLHGGYGSEPQDMLAAIEKGDSVRVINMMALYGKPEMSAFGDYVRVGEADVTLRLLPRDEQTRKAVETLNRKLNELRAAYLTKQQEIMEQISKLQALDYVEAA